MLITGKAKYWQHGEEYRPEEVYRTKQPESSIETFGKMVCDGTQSPWEL